MNELAIAMFEAFGRGHQMDAPEGPICRCGRPSREQSGWCGQCAVEQCWCQKDKLNRLIFSHDCPKHGQDLP